MVQSRGIMVIMKYKTTKQVAEMEGVTRILASVWAHDNGVLVLGGNYMWTPAKIRKFKNRNTKRGRPLGSKTRSRK
jgi:hypothetical protein